MNLSCSRAHPAVVFESIPAPGPWIREAACANEPTDLFFPEDPTGSELAKAICGDCKVRTECLGYAIDLPALDGIWGGLTRQERAGLRRHRGCRLSIMQGACSSGRSTPKTVRGCPT